MTETSLEILVGTGNAGKAAEICFALRDLGIDFRTLAQVPDVLFVNESGLTYEENAILKATSYSRQFSMWTIADDSGLEVEALGGAPGVLSARYAGAGKSDADRIDYLLGQIANAPDTTHEARFVCSMVLADSRSRILHVARGICEGTITDRPSGDNGFGYDPIFIPAGFDATFGELPAEVKNAISHRGAALKSMRVFMEEFLSSNLTDGVSNS